MMTSVSGTVGLMMEHLITLSFIALGKEATLSSVEAIHNGREMYISTAWLLFIGSFKKPLLELEIRERHSHPDV